MTEIEKLLSEGFISDEFLKEEVRCDYRVSKEMKKSWAIQLDLLRELIEVCIKNDLKVWVVGGTLLGAIRHKGFIPWDDDTDVIMFREDYDKLMSIASKEFHFPYFLQSPFEVDTKIYFPTARLCNSNTFLDHNVCQLKDITWNSGIFLDIFVLDKVPSSRFCLKYKFNIIRILSILLHSYVLNKNKNWLTRLANKILHIPFLKCDSYKICNLIHRIARNTKAYSNEQVVSLIATPYTLDRNVFNKADWDETSWLQFENIKVPVPCGYDGILKVAFGDYMKFPPINKRGVWHHFTVDPDTPYQDIIKNSISS